MTAALTTSNSLFSTTLHSVAPLLCGSFNPPTTMHITLMNYAKLYIENDLGKTFEKGIFSPVHSLYGKPDLVSSTHRVNMLNLATKNYPQFVVDSWECEQDTWLPTADVLDHVANMDVQNPCQVPLLCGQDLFTGFINKVLWTADDLNRILAPDRGVFVAPRGGFLESLDSIYDRIKASRTDIDPENFKNVYLLDTEPLNISSTFVRKALQSRQSEIDLLDPQVFQYCQENQLYIKNN